MELKLLISQNISLFFLENLNLNLEKSHSLEATFLPSVAEALSFHCQRDPFQNGLISKYTLLNYSDIFQTWEQGEGLGNWHYILNLIKKINSWELQMMTPSEDQIWPLNAV